MKIFDCNCSIGFSSLPEDQKTVCPDELLASMDRCGIDEALVWSVLSRNYDACIGNDELIKMLNGQERLFPYWVITPYQPGDFPTPDELLLSMKQNGVKAVRVWPSATWSNFSLKPWVMDKFYKVFGQHRIPLFIDRNETNWNEIYEIAHSYLEMPVVITGISYRDGRYAYSIMELCKNVYIETSMYKAYRAFEHLAETCGADRLLFGTGYPKYSMGSALALVSYSDMSEDDKSKILAGNITRLLSEVCF